MRIDEIKEAVPSAKVTVYPDTAKGAEAMLRDESTYFSNGETVVRARPDPEVQGVWEVITSANVRCIAYLAGYKDPWGNVRQFNDFEETD